MLSRLYALFLGMFLIMLAIGGYGADQFMGALNLGSLAPTIWLLTGLVALAVGFFVRNVNTLRSFAGLVGALYLMWGLIGVVADSNLRDVLITMMAALGAAGVGAALAPAQWIRERESYAHG
jgi:hypothetical protein